jgi:hypothetical protein
MFKLQEVEKQRKKENETIFKHMLGATTVLNRFHVGNDEKAKM